MKKCRQESLGMCPSCCKLGRKKKNIGKLVLKNGKYGKFYGCSRYPECKYTEKFKEWIHINSKLTPPPK